MRSFGPLQPVDYQAFLGCVFRAGRETGPGRLKPAQVTALSSEVQTLETGAVHSPSRDLIDFLARAEVRRDLGEAHRRWQAFLAGGRLPEPELIPASLAPLFAERRIHPAEWEALRGLAGRSILSVDDLHRAFSLLSLVSGNFGKMFTSQSGGGLQVEWSDKSSGILLPPIRFLERPALSSRTIRIRRGEGLLTLVRLLALSTPIQHWPEEFKPNRLTVDPQGGLEPSIEGIERIILHESALGLAAEAIVFRDARRCGIDLPLPGDSDPEETLERYALFHRHGVSALVSRLAGQEGYERHAAQIDAILAAIILQKGEGARRSEPVDWRSLYVDWDEVNGTLRPSIENFPTGFITAFQKLRQLALREIGDISLVKGKSFLEVLDMGVSRATEFLELGETRSPQDLILRMFRGSVVQKLAAEGVKGRSLLGERLREAAPLRPRPRPAEVKVIAPEEVETEAAADKVLVFGNHLRYLERLRELGEIEGESYFKALLDIARNAPDPLGSRLFGELMVLVYETAAREYRRIHWLADALADCGYVEEAEGLLADFVEMRKGLAAFQPADLAAVIRTAGKLPLETALRAIESAARNDTLDLYDAGKKLTQQELGPDFSASIVAISSELVAFQELLESAGRQPSSQIDRVIAYYQQVIRDLAAVSKREAAIPVDLTGAMLTSPLHFEQAIDLISAASPSFDLMRLLREGWSDMIKNGMTAVQQIRYARTWLTKAREFGAATVSDPVESFRLENDLDLKHGFTRPQREILDLKLSMERQAWSETAAHPEEAWTYLKEALSVAELCLSEKKWSLRAFGQDVLRTLPSSRGPYFQPHLGLGLDLAVALKHDLISYTVHPLEFRVDGLMALASSDAPGSAGAAREAFGLFVSEPCYRAGEGLMPHANRLKRAVRVIAILSRHGLIEEARALLTKYLSGEAEITAVFEQTHPDAAGRYLKPWRVVLESVGKVLAIQGPVLEDRTQEAMQGLHHWSEEIRQENSSGRPYYTAEAVETAAQMLIHIPALAASAQGIYELAIDKMAMGKDPSEEVRGFLKKIRSQAALSPKVKDALLCHFIDTKVALVGFLRGSEKLEQAIEVAVRTARDLYDYLQEDAREHYPKTEERLVHFLSSLYQRLTPTSHPNRNRDLLVVSRHVLLQIFREDSWIFDAGSARRLWDRKRDWVIRRSLSLIHPELLEGITDEIVLPDGSWDIGLIESGLVPAARLEEVVTSALHVCRSAKNVDEYERNVARAAARWANRSLVEKGGFEEATTEDLFGDEPEGASRRFETAVPRPWKVVAGPIRERLKRGRMLNDFDLTLLREILQSETEVEAAQKKGFYTFILSRRRLPPDVRRMAFEGLVRSQRIDPTIAGWHRAIREGKYRKVTETRFLDWMADLLGLHGQSMPLDRHLVFLLHEYPERSRHVFEQFRRLKKSRDERDFIWDLDIRDPVDMAFLFSREWVSTKVHVELMYQTDMQPRFVREEVPNYALRHGTGPFQIEIGQQRLRIRFKWVPERGGLTEAQYRYRVLKETGALTQERLTSWMETYAQDVPAAIANLPQDLWALTANILIAMDPEKKATILKRFDNASTPTDQMDAMVFLLEQSGHAQVGQMLSVFLPSPWRERFERLQDEVAPSTREAILETLKKEWKGKIGEPVLVDTGWIDRLWGEGGDEFRRTLNPALVEEIEKAQVVLEYPPLKSGTVGEIMKGQLRDGRLIAVKTVTRPRRESIDRMSAELDQAAAALDHMGIRTIGGLSVRAFKERLKKTVSAEGNLLKELENAGRFGDLPGGLSRPWYEEGLSSSSVLVMEWIDGVKITDPNLSEAGRRASLEAIPRLLGKPFLDLFFQQDPHPGNFLKPRDEGKTCLIDFGKLEQVTPREAVTAARFIKAYLKGDMNLITQSVIDLVPAHERQLLKTSLLEKTARSILGTAGAHRDIRMGGAIDLLREIASPGISVSYKYFQIIRYIGTLEKVCLRLAESVSERFDVESFLWPILDACLEKYGSSPKDLGEEIPPYEPERGYYLDKTVLEKRRGELKKQDFSYLTSGEFFLDEGPLVDFSRPIPETTEPDEGPSPVKFIIEGGEGNSAASRLMESIRKAAEKDGTKVTVQMGDGGDADKPGPGYHGPVFDEKEFGDRETIPMTFDPLAGTRLDVHDLDALGETASMEMLPEPIEIPPYEGPVPQAAAFTMARDMAALPGDPETVPMSDYRLTERGEAGRWLEDPSRQVLFVPTLDGPSRLGIDLVLPLQRLVLDAGRRGYAVEIGSEEEVPEIASDLMEISANAAFLHMTCDRLDAVLRIIGPVMATRTDVKFVLTCRGLAEGEAYGSREQVVRFRSHLPEPLGPSCDILPCEPKPMSFSQFREWMYRNIKSQVQIRRITTGEIDRLIAEFYAGVPAIPLVLEQLRPLLSFKKDFETNLKELRTMVASRSDHRDGDAEFLQVYPVRFGPDFVRVR